MVTTTGYGRRMTDADHLPTTGRFAAAGYEIECHTDRRMAVIRVTDRWDAATTAAYARDLSAATRRMVAAGGYRGALFDVSAYPAQSDAVAAYHGAAMRRARWLFGVRAAMVVSDATVQRPLAALAEHAFQRVFDRRADALDWLLG